MIEKFEDTSFLASDQEFPIDQKSPNTIDSIAGLTPRAKRRESSIFVEDYREKDSRRKKAGTFSFFQFPSSSSTSTLPISTPALTHLTPPPISTNSLSSLHPTVPALPPLRLFNRTTSRFVDCYHLSAHHETTSDVLEIFSGDILTFSDSQNQLVVPQRVSLLVDLPQKTSIILEEESGAYHLPRFDISPAIPFCIYVIYRGFEFQFLCIRYQQSAHSLKDFYTLVLEKDPSQAYQTLESIPLYSRLPFVSFRNQEGEEDFRGQTALHAAASAGHLQLVHLLLESGSDKDALNNNNCSAIYLASANGHHQVVKLLLDIDADKNVSDLSGATPLYAAAYNGHHRVVEVLLAAGANQHPSYFGAAPIAIASFKGHHRVVAMLLAAGADKNCTYYGSTPLSIASFKGHHWVVEILLNAGAEKDASDKDGATALWMASFNGHDRVVELLLAAGASDNASNAYGASPICIASFNGHIQVVEMLLAAGADKNSPMNDGRTPIHVAFQNGHYQVVEIFTRCWCSSGNSME